MHAPRALKVIAPWLVALALALWAANFLWFLRLYEAYGGSALGGVIRGDHYYLSDHGALTETNRTVWETIRLREWGVWFGVPLIVISVVYILLGYIFPAIMGLRQGATVEERVRAVRASGELLASGVCSGSIAGVRLGAPLIAIEVYPGGLTVRPLPRGPAAILRAELRSVKSAGWNRVEIWFVSPDITAPIVSHTAPQSVLGVELNRLAVALAPTAL